MKSIIPKLVDLFQKGYCTPQIARIAKLTKEPATTIQYNIKKMEKEGIIKSYKAVFDYKKIDQGFCSYVMINLGQKQYGNPEDIAKKLSNLPEIESVDICTGEYELIIKMRTKDIDQYYEFVKKLIEQYGFAKTMSMTSLKQLKTEFVIN